MWIVTKVQNTRIYSAETLRFGLNLEHTQVACGECGRSPMQHQRCSVLGLSGLVGSRSGVTGPNSAHGGNRRPHIRRRIVALATAQVGEPSYPPMAYSRPSITAAGTLSRAAYGSNRRPRIRSRIVALAAAQAGVTANPPMAYNRPSITAVAEQPNSAHGGNRRPRPPPDRSARCRQGGVIVVPADDVQDRRSPAAPG